MSKQHDYLNQTGNPVVSIINGVDHDIHRIEGILMLGYVLVLLSPLFAPITPPHILLPLMALCFFCSVCCARFNFYNIHRKVYFSTSSLEQRHIAYLQPVIDIFNAPPAKGLNEGFNPLKNIRRTLKSVLGAWLINPFWLPIFYLLGMQIAEEKQLILLKQTVVMIKQRVRYWS
jgi:hypothetical protein